MAEISFARIPSANRVPSAFVEIDGTNALASASPVPHRVLIIGLRLSTGTAAEATVYPINSEFDGDALFDVNSQLATMTRAYKRMNQAAEVRAMGMLEASGGVAAAGSIAFSGTCSKDSSCQIRIGDQRVVVAVASGTTSTALVTQLVTQAALQARVPMTATASTSTLNLSARHKGTHGNEVTIDVEVLPTGITATITQPSGGATNPTIATVIAAMPEASYDSIVIGWNDATSILALEQEMDRRWGPLIKQPGHIFTGKSGTQGVMTTYGASRNSQYSTVIATGLSPTPFWVWACQVAARDAQRCDSLNPNRPRNGLTLIDCEAPKRADQLNAVQRNLLLFDGMSTYKVDLSGAVSIERLVTTYQANASGVADATYLAIETMRNLWGIYKECLAIGSKYGDYMLAPDGTAVDSGVPVMTPSLMRGELVALNTSLMRRGRTKDQAGFEATLLVSLTSTDVERLNVQMSPRLVGGLVTLANKISFTL